MDFASPDFVLTALQERLEHPILGYSKQPESLTRAFQGWLEHHFSWQVPEEWIVWLPGVVPGLNMAAHTLSAQQHIMVPTPIYYPFLDIGENANLKHILTPLALVDGSWRMDMERMRDDISKQTKMVFIASPQNPTGRAYAADELTALAEFIEHNDLLLVSDDIHCNLTIDPEVYHLPIAHAVPEIAHRTITLFAATKTYNIPGLPCAAAVIPNAQLREQFTASEKGLMSGVGPLNHIASQACFDDRSDWLPNLLDQLRRNEHNLRKAVGTRMYKLDATYLAWINISDLGLSDVQAHFEHYGLGISDGKQFGLDGYIRFNFGCPDSTLKEGLGRLKASLNCS
jgi:cystathionine beta-lyase